MATMARRVRVFGRVQGVFFRAFTRELAEAAGVGGWVRNLADGSVEAAIEGDEEAVRAVIEGVREGPPASQVERVDVSDEAPGGLAGGFRILR